MNTAMQELDKREMAGVEGHGWSKKLTGMDARTQHAYVAIIPLLVTTMVFAATCLEVRAEVIGPNDFVVAIKEAPVLDQSETLAVAPAGTVFVAERVNGPWILVSTVRDGRSISGWIETSRLAKTDGKLRLCRAFDESIRYNYGRWIGLPKGAPHVIRFQSTYPVDVFVVSDEGKAAYEYVIKNSGQMSSYWRRLNVREAEVRWDPPDDRQYWFIVDNTTFPDGGSPGDVSTPWSMVWLHDEPRPPEPIAGRGLIIGKVTFQFDGYKGKNERYAKSLTVVIGHKAEGSDDSSFEQTEAATDSAGYFAVGNVSPERQYWLKEVKGENFSAPIPFQMSTTIRSKSSDGDSKTTDVWDMGHFALTVNADGSMGCELSSPGVSVSKKAGESGQVLQFESSSPALDRHEWFSRAYSASGWALKVEVDRQRIQREREKNKPFVPPTEQPTAPAPPSAPTIPPAPKDDQP